MKYSIFSELFYPATYVPLLSQDIFSTLCKAYDVLKKQSDISLEFVSRLIGKLCISGYGGKNYIYTVYI